MIARLSRNYTFMVLEEFFSGHSSPPPNPILRNPGHILPPHLRFPLIVSSDLHLESQVEVGSVSVCSGVPRGMGGLTPPNSKVLTKLSRNSPKVPKIKKILLYEMKFLVPNYSCLQNHWLGGYRPPDPRSLFPLSPTEFVEPPPAPNKIPGYATVCLRHPAVTFM
jgi:hypothetical protein